MLYLMLRTRRSFQAQYTPWYKKHHSMRLCLLQILGWIRLYARHEIKQKMIGRLEIFTSISNEQRRSNLQFFKGGIWLFVPPSQQWLGDTGDFQERYLFFIIIALNHVESRVPILRERCNEASC